MAYATYQMGLTHEPEDEEPQDGGRRAMEIFEKVTIEKDPQWDYR